MEGGAGEGEDECGYDRVTGCGECVEAMERIDLFVEHTLFILRIDRFHVFG